MKQFLAGTATVLVAVLLLSCSVKAISAQKAIVIDGLTGKVLYEKQPDSKSLIASTTKIMTALIVCQQCMPLELVRIPREAVGVEGSSMYLQEGEILTVQDLLYGMMLHSGNDAATALAIHCSGNVDAFVALMNEKASQYALNQTHFANPHGLDAVDHYSTARDLANLTLIAMREPIFAQTVSMKTVRIGARQLTNHNKLLWRVEGAQGVKTGYTKAAGRILVSSAQRHGRSLIAVTIDDGNDWLDHAILYNQGFSRYTPQTPILSGQVVGQVSVFGGDQARVDVIAMEDFSVAVAAGEKIDIRLSSKNMAFAPVVEGADAGFAYVCIDGCNVGKIRVCYGQTVEQQPEKQKKHFWQRWFGEEK